MSLALIRRLVKGTALTAAEFDGNLDKVETAILERVPLSQAALSVLGRASNSTGNVAAIAAGTDGHVLRRAGTALAFGTVATAGLADQAVTNAKLANMAANTVKVRAATSSGAASDLAMAASTVLARLASGNIVAATPAELRNLLNVADGATANQSDTHLLARGNHTGAQAISTVTGLQDALDGKASTSALQAAVDGRVAVVDADGDPATPRPTGVVSALWIGSPTMPDEAVPGADLVLLPAGAPNRDPARGRSTSSTAFTLALDDMNTIVVCTSESSVVVTIPAEVTEAFPEWSLVNILRRGAGTVTITAAEGVTLNGALAGSVVISAQHGVAALAKIGTDEWNIAGAVE
jgi:hypothetical protein